MLISSISSTVLCHAESRRLGANLEWTQCVARGASSLLESSTPAMSVRGGNTTAAATTGPASGPHAASSTPAMSVHPGLPQHQLEMPHGLQAQAFAALTFVSLLQRRYSGARPAANRAAGVSGSAAIPACRLRGSACGSHRSKARRWCEAWRNSKRHGLIARAMQLRAQQPARLTGFALSRGTALRRRACTSRRARESRRPAP